jgi:hypothetical protein
MSSLTSRRFAAEWDWLSPNSQRVPAYMARIIVAAWHEEDDGKFHSKIRSDIPGNLI